MSIVTLQECLDFCGVDSAGTFEVTAVNDVLVLTTDQGGPCSIDTPDGTYEGSELATALQTAMNADDTLTGSGTITFAVSYSATTYKFTIDAGSGHTIAYTNTGSDAGWTFGFDSDHSAAQTITSDNAVPGDPSDIVQTIHDGVEAIATSVLKRTPDSTAYTKRVNGSGGDKLILEQYPVTQLVKVSVSFEDVIKIKNTAADASNAYFTIDSDSLTLVVVGGANEDSTDLAFSTYATVSTLVAQINATGKGWSAAVVNADYDDLETTGLLETFNRYCGAAGGDTASYEYIYWGEPLEDVKLADDSGILYSPSGFPAGFKNVYVAYTAGYSVATMPSDLKLQVLIAVDAIYRRKREQGLAVSSFSAGSMSVKYLDILAEMESKISRYGDDSKCLS